jgi:hypothetical protein
LRQAVAGSEHPQRAPKGLVLGRQGRHPPTVQEAKYPRLRGIARSSRTIASVVRKNPKRDGELAA